MKKILITLFTFLIILLIMSCAPAERSASKVLDNAGSVVRSGSEKLFIETTPTPTTPN